MLLNKAVILGSFFLLSLARAECTKSYVYFDLGDTLIDTKTFRYNPMFYMDGAREYVDALQARGYSVGIIADIPESWGVNYPSDAPITDLVTAKIVRTQDFVAGKIADDGVAWRAGDAPFDWSPFGATTGAGPARVFSGRVFLSQTAAERKDTGNPILFARAKEQAARAGCQVLYYSEDAVQLTIAQRMGIATYQIDVTVPGQRFVPIDDLEIFVKRSIESLRVRRRF